MFLHLSDSVHKGRVHGKGGVCMADWVCVVKGGVHGKRGTCIAKGGHA